MLIPIDDDVVPDGYEPVRYGLPNIGEHYVANGEITVATVSLAPRLIVRRKWQPPAWLKPGWIWTDNALLWRWSAIAPTWNKHNKWWSNAPSVEISREAFDFVPPPCTDPSQSLREIKGPQQ